MTIKKEYLQKLQSIDSRHHEIESLLADSGAASFSEKIKELGKEFNQLELPHRLYSGYLELQKELENQRAAAAAETDKEMLALYAEDIERIELKTEDVEKGIDDFFMPAEKLEPRPAILEIRQGTGGNEAALFAGDLFRMYTRYSDIKSWKTEMISSSPTNLGGFKEVVFSIKGLGAYNKLRYESGVHRVQRIPITEAGGRIHTSAATVAVLIEPNEVEVNIDPGDLKTDTFRASGAGGQHVNKTSSAIRITHIPTGIVVECQDERSQHQNRAKAMRLLRARLMQMLEEERKSKIDAERKTQVGSGDRSERIRTYNFPQNRVTDHRAGITLYQLESVISGELDDFLGRLVNKMRAIEAGEISIAQDRDE
jgi:peptide chain release factor 1